MTRNNSYNDTNSASITAVPNWEHLPCVQYGYPDGEGPIREPILRTIFESVPENAITASPVYLVTRDQYDQQESLDNPYRVKGYTSIATKLQDECEAADRVLYPIHVESDELLKVGPSTVEAWIKEFVEDWLGVSYDTCTVYYSGSRSIHAHVPRFVLGEYQRHQLKELAETFCEETGAELDCGLYHAKRMFRLPGVDHEKTSLPKVEIDGGWDDNRLFEQVTATESHIPESYESVLRHTFVKESLIRDSASLDTYTPHDLFRILDPDKTKLEFGPTDRTIETPLIEQEEFPDHLPDSLTWLAYNAKEFSPYALAKGGSPSVAVVEVKGTPFARKNVTIGNSPRPVYALVPSYFYGARGCAGGEFIKDHEHAPLQLSKHDYEKWEEREYEPGDNVVIIGGKSHRSVIFRVESWHATVAGHALTGEDASRKAALDYLESEGYDVGKAGETKEEGSTTQTWKTAGTRGQPKPSPPSPVGNEDTDAARLQRQAEQEGIDTLGRKEVANVANRLLQIGGWSLAWGWLKEQFGDRFNPEKTWGHLKGIVEYYDDFPAVEVPPRPR